MTALVILLGANALFAAACDEPTNTGRSSPDGVAEDTLEPGPEPDDAVDIDDLNADGGALDAGTDTSGADTGDGDETVDTTDGRYAEIDEADEFDEINDGGNVDIDVSGLDGDAEIDAAEDTDIVDVGSEDASRACSPPLEVHPAVAWTHPYELVTLTVRGGTGQARFELLEDYPEATLESTLGIYLAGGSSGLTDRVRVTDLGCEGEAFAEVRVVASLEVSPHTATLAPGEMLAIEVGGGSGRVTHELTQNRSGASLSDDGTYRAGPNAGSDRVRVSDLETGAAFEVAITVKAGARFAVVPARVVLPVGARWKVETEDGSGVFEATLTGEAATFADGWVTAAAKGGSELALTDRHTGAQATLVVTVVDALTFDRYLAGDGSLLGAALAPGDIDGDGLPDALISTIEADVDHLNAGAVYIYRGVETEYGKSLDPTPARILGGDARADNLGRTVLVADLDGDDHPELLIGSPFADPSGSNVGLVKIYPGREGSFFGDRVSRTFSGDDAGDTFGTSMAICDFNGDSWPDLAVGAPLAEDATLAGTTDSGGVLLWLGSPVGFAANPDQRLFGERPTASGLWGVTAAAKLGGTMAAGDLDGDGYCDLVVGAPDATVNAANDGTVVVFRGRGPDALSAGGVASHPSLAWAGIDADSPSSRLGLSLAVGDVDGDGLDDLAIGQPAARVGTFASHGVVRLHRGQPFPEPPTDFAAPTTLDWTWSAGGSASDLFGYVVEIGDWDGVPPLDLFALGLDDEVSGGPSGAGVINVIRGVAYATPAASQSVTFAGEAAGARFGAMFAPMGDLDGDGTSEILARAPLDARLGPRVGVHQLVRTTPGAARVVLDAPQVSAGARIGQALALVPDLDRDGYPELVIGAPTAQAGPGPAATIFRGGVMTLHRGGVYGFASAPLTRIDTTTSLAAGEGLGDSLVGLRDFDGDGYGDLASLVARDSAAAANCGVARASVGAVHIFRGKADGTLSTTPSFIYWGEQIGDRIERIAAADLDGDGKTDLIVGSTLWDGPDDTPANVGGFAVIRGQALGAAVVNDCAADRVFLGASSADVLGSALTPVRDLDGDGCDEVAVGARGEDQSMFSNGGVVRVVFGWGAACAARGGSLEPRVLAFAPYVSNAAIGTSLAAGDLDGDGLDDVAIGGPGFILGGSAIGATWALTGERILALRASARPWVDLTRPAATDLHRFVAEDATLDVRVEGRLAGELFGQTVLIANPRGNEFGALIVASPNADIGGTPRAGAVLVYPWTAQGLAPRPVFALGGETAMPATEFGNAMVLHEPASPDEPAQLVVGIPVSRLLGLDEGAVIQVPDFPLHW